MNGGSEVITNTSAGASAHVNVGPVSDIAPGLSRLTPEKIWHEPAKTVEKCGDGGWLSGPGRVVCFRWGGKPGMWDVDFQVDGFYVTQRAVVDDFGTLVRVGRPS